MEAGGPDAGLASGPKVREAARVRTALVEQREMVRTVETTTTVESEREIKLYPRTSGVVTAIHAEEGDSVAKDAVLLELDAAAAQNAVQDARVRLAETDDAIKKAEFAVVEAEARVTKLKLEHEQKMREFERNEKTGLVSAQQLDTLKVQRDAAGSEVDSARLAIERAKVEIAAARTTREKAQLSIERAELDLSWTKLTAPFAGVIAGRTVRVGDTTGPTTAAFTLTDASALSCVLYRPQRELALYAAKDTLEIHARAEALPQARFKGSIKRVSPSIDPQSGSFRVVVALEPRAEAAADAPASSVMSRLLPGMLVRVEVVVERHPQALVVPKRALRREGEDTLVYIIDAGKARRIQVAEGFADDEHVEVIPQGQDLAPGARVIVVGNRELEDGADVVEEG